jgi:NAD+-dependent protein deacetylase sirtuin 4
MGSATPGIEAFDALCRLLRGRRVVVLSGAGCSTESGIPDYRSPAAASRRRAPVQFQEFVRSEPARVRYWARATAGWPRFSAARPNPAHVALARLEDAGVVAGIITQNVDGLHHAAGSRRVLELHGTLARVRCLACDAVSPRDRFHARLLTHNREWADAVDARGAVAAPDGDVELAAADLAGFRVPSCHACGGVVKPDVVFFGENVPRPRVDAAWRIFGEAGVLLVAGSSLTVWSGRRFTDRARRDGVPIAIINDGETRADADAAARLHDRLGAALPRLAGELLQNFPHPEAPGQPR